MIKLSSFLEDNTDSINSTHKLLLKKTGGTQL